MFNYLLVFLAAFFIVWLSLFFFRHVALKADIFTSAKRPLVGGISIFTGFLAAYCLGNLYARIFSAQTAAIVAASFLVFLAGIWDDHKGLASPLRTAVQILAVLLMATWDVRTNIAGIGEILNFVLTLAWVLVATHSFKYLDAVAGSGSGVAALSCFTLFIISWFHRDPVMAIPSLALSVAATSFLTFNFSSGRRLGNGGSYTLGFLISALAINISYAQLERRIALFTPLFVLGVPLLVFALRLASMVFGKSGLQGDILASLGAGYRQEKILVAVLYLQAFFCVSALLVSASSNEEGILVILLTVGLSLSVIRRMVRA